MENIIDSVRNSSYVKTINSVTGEEALSVGQGISLYLNEFAHSIDKKMAYFTKSIHKVDVAGLSNDLRDRGVLFVKNGGVELPTPEGYKPGVGAMNNYVENATRAVYLVSSLKTETARLYDWIKQIVRKGRVDRSFQWTITDFDQIVSDGEQFVRSLPEDRSKATYSLSQVYVNFEEFFSIVNKYNTVVGSFKHKEVDLATKELDRVYKIGDLLVKKIEANDIVLSQRSIEDIEIIINKFSRLANIAGALMTLLNECKVTLDNQANVLKNLK